MEFKPLQIGIDNFEMLITRGYYMVWLFIGKIV